MRKKDVPWAQAQCSPCIHVSPYPMNRFTHPWRPSTANIVLEQAAATNLSCLSISDASGSSPNSSSVQSLQTTKDQRSDLPHPSESFQHHFTSACTRSGGGTYLRSSLLSPATPLPYPPLPTTYPGPGPIRKPNNGGLRRPNSSRSYPTPHSPRTLVRSPSLVLFSVAPAHPDPKRSVNGRRRCHTVAAYGSMSTSHGLIRSQKSPQTKAVGPGAHSPSPFPTPTPPRHGDEHPDPGPLSSRTCFTGACRSSVNPGPRRGGLGLLRRREGVWTIVENRHTVPPTFQLPPWWCVRTTRWRRIRIWKSRAQETASACTTRCVHSRRRRREWEPNLEMTKWCDKLEGGGEGEGLSVHARSSVRANNDQSIHRGMWRIICWTTITTLCPKLIKILLSILTA